MYQKSMAPLRTRSISSNYHDSSGIYGDHYDFPLFTAQNPGSGIVDNGSEYTIGLAGSSGPLANLAKADAFYRARFSGILVEVMVSF